MKDKTILFVRMILTICVVGSYFWVPAAFDVIGGVVAVWFIGIGGIVALLYPIYLFVLGYVVETDDRMRRFPGVIDIARKAYEKYTPTRMWMTYFNLLVINMILGCTFAAAGWTVTAVMLFVITIMTFMCYTHHIAMLRAIWDDDDGKIKEKDS